MILASAAQAAQTCGSGAILASIMCSVKMNKFVDGERGARNEGRRNERNSHKVPNAYRDMYNRSPVELNGKSQK